MRKLRRLLIFISVLVIGLSAYKGSFWVSRGKAVFLAVSGKSYVYTHGYHFNMSAALFGDLDYRELPLRGRIAVSFSAPVPSLERLSDDFLNIRVTAAFDYSIADTAFVLRPERVPSEIAEMEFQRIAVVFLRRMNYSNFSDSYSSEKMLKVWSIESAKLAEDIAASMKASGITVSSLDLGMPVFPSDERYLAVLKYALDFEKKYLDDSLLIIREKAERDNRRFDLQMLSGELDVISPRIKDNPLLLKYLVSKNLFDGRAVSPDLLFRKLGSEILGQPDASESDIVKTVHGKDIDNFR